MTAPEMRYVERALIRGEVDARAGLTLLDFGTEWCVHCMAARNLVNGWVKTHPDIEHIRLEDGPGRRLGRSFRVKLWPSLILMRDGEEVARVVRPRDAQDFVPMNDALGA